MTGRARWFVVGLVAVVLVASACGDDDPVDRMREAIAERAADPAFELTTTVPGGDDGRPGDGEDVPDDAFVSFHTGPEVTDDQYEAVRRAVLLVRIEMAMLDPIDVVIGTRPEDLGLDPDVDDVVVVDPSSLASGGTSSEEVFVAAARETALLAQEVASRGAVLPGEAGLPDESRTVPPHWLSVGQAEVLAWQLAREYDELEVEWDERRSGIVALAAATDLPLEAFEVDVPDGLDPETARALAHLAVEYLASGVEPHVLHRDLWPAIVAEGWEVAFSRSVEMSVEEFYAAFAGWRADGFPG